MLKKISFYALIIASYSHGMQNTLRVSQQCAATLQNIDHDAPLLHYWLKGAFQDAAKQNNPLLKPSIFLTILTTHQAITAPLDEQLRFAKTTHYLRGLETDHLDSVFTKKLAETKSVKQAWQTVDDHFEEPLKKTLVQLKTSITHNDAERIKFQDDGIFIQGDTIYVMPKLGREDL